MDLAQHVLERCNGENAAKRDVPGPPIQAFHLIGQNRARNAESVWKTHLEGIALDLVRDRAKEGKSDAAIIGVG